MSVRTVTREALKQRIDNRDSFLLVDVLSPAEYGRDHLPGALNLPYSRIQELAPTLLPDKSAEIVVYCSKPT